MITTYVTKKYYKEHYKPILMGNITRLKYATGGIPRKVIMGVSTMISRDYGIDDTTLFNKKLLDDLLEESYWDPEEMFYAGSLAPEMMGEFINGVDELIEVIAVRIPWMEYKKLGIKDNQGTVELDAQFIAQIKDKRPYKSIRED